MGHGLPMRGDNHLNICRYGSPLDGIRSIAFLAKGLACSSVCRLSFGSDIHSRMIFRRVSWSGFMLKFLWFLLAFDKASSRSQFVPACTNTNPFAALIWHRPLQWWVAFQGPTS